ncbi:MAG: hypothetical protein U0270_33470 [Labilithrix sp.]
MIRSRAIAIALLLGCLAVGAVAAAGNDDRGVAEAALKEVAGSPKKDVANELVARSRAALDRGAQLRTKGDEKHALLADGVARSWAEAARDAVKAAAIEETATRARTDATDAGLVADRERALLEEAVAQSGRLRAQLEGAKEKEAPARTSAQANSDAGAKPAPKTAPKAAPLKLDGGAP